MTDDWRKELVRKILAELGKRKTRMTYSAVACLLDVQPQGVGKWLGERRPEASWVVKKRGGRQTGYETWQCHPDLLQAACSNQVVLQVARHPWSTSATRTSPRVRWWVLNRSAGFAMLSVNEQH